MPVKFSFPHHVRRRPNLHQHHPSSIHPRTNPTRTQKSTHFTTYAPTRFDRRSRSPAIRDVLLLHLSTLTLFPLLFPGLGVKRGISVSEEKKSEEPQTADTDGRREVGSAPDGRKGWRFGSLAAPADLGSSYPRSLALGLPRTLAQARAYSSTAGAVVERIPVLSQADISTSPNETEGESENEGNWQSLRRDRIRMRAREARLVASLMRSHISSSRDEETGFRTIHEKMLSSSHGRIPLPKAFTAFPGSEPVSLSNELLRMRPDKPWRLPILSTIHSLLRRSPVDEEHASSLQSTETAICIAQLLESLADLPTKTVERIFSSILDQISRQSTLTMELKRDLLESGTCLLVPKLKEVNQRARSCHRVRARWRLLRLFRKGMEEALELDAIVLAFDLWRHWTVTVVNIDYQDQTEYDSFADYVEFLREDQRRRRFLANRLFDRIKTSMPAPGREEIECCSTIAKAIGCDEELIRDSGSAIFGLLSTFPFPLEAGRALQHRFPHEAHHPPSPSLSSTVDTQVEGQERIGEVYREVHGSLIKVLSRLLNVEIRVMSLNYIVSNELFVHRGLTSVYPPITSTENRYYGRLDTACSNALLRYSLRYLQSTELAEMILKMTLDGLGRGRPDNATGNILLREATLLRDNRLAWRVAEEFFGFHPDLDTKNDGDRPDGSQASNQDPDPKNLFAARSHHRSHARILPGVFSPDAYTIPALLTFLTVNSEYELVQKLIFRLIPEISPASKSYPLNKPAPRMDPRFSNSEVFVACLNAVAKLGKTGLAERVWEIAKREERDSWTRRGLGDRDGPRKPWYLPIQAYTIMMQIYASEARRSQKRQTVFVVGWGRVNFRNGGDFRTTGRPVAGGWRHDLKQRLMLESQVPIPRWEMARRVAWIEYTALRDLIRNHARRGGRGMGGHVPSSDYSPRPPLPDERFFNALLELYAGPAIAQRRSELRRLKSESAAEHGDQVAKAKESTNDARKRTDPRLALIIDDIKRSGFRVPRLLEYLVQEREVEGGEGEVRGEVGDERRPPTTTTSELPLRLSIRHPSLSLPAEWTRIPVWKDRGTPVVDKVWRKSFRTRKRRIDAV